MSFYNDTSIDSAGKWRAIGSQQPNSSRVSTHSLHKGSSRSSLKKFRPSKEKSGESSKVFNRPKSKVESHDKSLISEGASEKGNKSTSRPNLFDSIKEDDEPMIRVNSIPSGEMVLDDSGSAPYFMDASSKKVLTGRSQRLSKEGHARKSTGSLSKRFSIDQSSPKGTSEIENLRLDYLRFKQKVITELELQKQYVSSTIDSILKTLTQQLAKIDQKYADMGSANVKASSLPKLQIPQKDLKVQNQTPSFSNIGVVTQEKDQGVDFQDDIEKEIDFRFAEFHSAIEKLRNDLDCLHEISAIQNDNSTLQSPMHSPNYRDSLFKANGALSSFLNNK